MTTSSFSKPIALDTGHKIVYYVFFPPRQKYASHVVHTNGPYVSSTMCVLCNVGSLALHIIMYTYLLPEKPTWYAKSRGDYFKAAIPMMPEENKAIASFSLDNF